MTITLRSINFLYRGKSNKLEKGKKYLKTKDQALLRTTKRFILNRVILFADPGYFATRLPDPSDTSVKKFDFDNGMNENNFHSLILAIGQTKHYQESLDLKNRGIQVNYC